MADLTTHWDAGLLSGDWVVDGGGLATGDDLATAVILSLFTDRRARDDDRLPDGAGGDRRGWWADGDAPEGSLGSRLWLLCREKRSEETRRRAVEYAREALAWLVEDGVAAAVTVDAQWDGLDRLSLLVTVMRPQGGRQVLRYGWAWAQRAA